MLYFCKVKCSTELVNWGNYSSFSYSGLTPTPSSFGWVVRAGSEEPLVLLWALAKEGHPCCRFHIPSKRSPGASTLLPELPKTDSPQARARLQQPIPEIPGNPSTLCLTGFIPGFTLVFIPERTGWPNRWVELESPMSWPGSAYWGCCRAASYKATVLCSSFPSHHHFRTRNAKLGRKQYKGSKGLLQHYWSEKAERASLPFIHASHPSRISSFHTAARIIY